MAGAIVLAVGPGAAASTKGKLHWAEGRLHELEADIDASNAHLSSIKDSIARQQEVLDEVQRGLNVLAGKLTLAQGAYEHTRGLIDDTHHALVEARVQYRTLRHRMDTRARALYEQGPLSDMEFVFGASSLADLTDRVEFVNALGVQDADVANQIEQVAFQLEQREAKLQVLRAREEDQIAALRSQQRDLNRKFQAQAGLLQQLNDQRAEQASVVASLADKQSRIDDLVSRFRDKLAAEDRARAEAAQRAAADSIAGSGSVSNDGPFSYCPVQGPHGYSDSFGAPRYAGGYHPHAGNDIISPRGTPIVAPFDGYAEADPNGLGGNAVIVRGDEGYVYNAHLDHYGTLGSVSAGTVIGYVGNTGDAQGGVTHDHFEWHPNQIPADPYRSVYGYTVIGTAIDPYPYLNQVC
jgi:murein DD-endopeptidase MepM/ murein hydrolase activator NlpD